MSTSVATKSTVASIAAVVTTLAFAVTASAASVSDLQTQVQALLAQIAAAQGGSSTTTTTTTTSSSCSFTQNLQLGSRGGQVMAVQQFLNSHGAVVASTGAGSPGNETSTFGPATKAAVKVFQGANGISPVSGYWGPLTRAAANAKCTTTTSNPGGSTTPVTSSGPIMVSLASNQPSGSVIAGQASADLADLVFTGSGAVQTLVLQRSGISTDSTAKNVYLYAGNVRISDSASIVNGVITFNSSSGLFNVSGSQTISVRADIDTSAASGNTIGVNVTSYTALGGTATAVNNVVGGLRTITTLTNAATLNFVNAVPTPSAATINAGTLGYSVWSNNLAVGNHAVNLKAISFKYIGSAPTNALANIKLYIDGIDSGLTPVWTTTNGSNRIGFDFGAAPKNLTTGTHIFDLRADIVAGSNRNFTVSVENAGDLIAEDVQVSGYNPSVTVAGSPFTSQNAGTITVGPGTLTVTQDPNFGGVTQVVGGSTNAAIASFKFQAYGEDVKVTTLNITPAITGAVGGNGTSLRNVTVYANGAPIGSAVSTWSGGAIPFSLGSSLIIPAGSTTTVQVHADMMDSSNVNYTGGNIVATANVPVNGYYGVNSSQYNTQALTQAGNSLSIVGSNVTFGVTPGFTAQTVSPNSSHVLIGSYTIQTGNAEDITVTNLAVALGGLQPLTNISNLTVSDGLSPVGQPTANNSFSVNYTVAKNTSHLIQIWADESSATGTTAIPTVTVTYRGNVSGVTNTTSGVAGPTITLNAGTLAAPTLDNSSAAAQFLVGGVSGAQLANYRFTATGSNVTITQLNFNAVGSNGIAAVNVGGVNQSVINAGAFSPVQVSGLNIAVAVGSQGVLVPVTANLAGVNSQSGNSSTTVALVLTGGQYRSGNQTLNFTASATSSNFTLVGTKPVVTVSSGGASGLLISNAQTKLGEVTVAADSGGDVLLNQVVFSLSGAGFQTGPLLSATSSDFILALGSSGSTNVNGNTCTVSGTTVTCAISGGYTVTAGSSATFSLLGKISGTAQTSTKASISTAVSAAGFQWKDLQGGAGNTFTGALIYNFPTNSWTVSQ